MANTKAKKASKKAPKRTQQSTTNKKVSDQAIKHLPKPSGNFAQILAIAGLAIALVVTTIMGIGWITTSCILGLFLCVIGLFQRSIKVDLWILIPLIVYLVFNFASSFATYGNLVEGYGALQLIYLVVYALVGCLNGHRANILKKLCVVWVAIVAIIGLFQFTIDSFSASAGRLSIILGNANSVGIFMVLGWFALISCKLEDEKEAAHIDIRELLLSGSGTYTDKATGKSLKRIPVADRLYGILSWIIPYTEPFILIALVLTLSMGSFLALIIGIIVYLICKKRQSNASNTGTTTNASTTQISWKQIGTDALFMIAKIAICFLVGLLMYTSAVKSRIPLMCEILLFYVIVLAVFWKNYERFLKSHKVTKAIIACVSVVCGIVAIVFRPSAWDTLTERFEMMGNGLSYMGVNPITGIGPNVWRYQNLADADTYFNTWQIHNGFIHAGVEFGVIAMLALIVLAVRCFMRHKKQASQGENVALLTSVFMDINLFMLGVISLFIMTAGNQERQGKALGAVGTRIFFIIIGFLYIDNLIVSLQVL